MEKKQEAQPGLLGECQGCGLPMLAKCGTVRISHWAHRGKCTGDSWWEPDTEWHRAWKGHFPESWQEVRHEADNGAKHVADVKTDQGCVLEFQHSPIAPEERQARNAFYKKLFWIVDGTKRKRDKAKFQDFLKEGIQVTEKAPVVKLRGFLDECALLRDWAGNPTPVFFDFGEEGTLWYLLPQPSEGTAYVIKFSRDYFIKLHRDGIQMAQDLEFWFNEIGKLVSEHDSNLRSRELNQRVLPVQNRRSQPQSFQHYLAGRTRFRRRF